MNFSIMNKQAIFILGILTLFFGAAYATTKIGAKPENNIATENVMNVNQENTIKTEALSASSEEIKVTPNTLLILKKYYTDCGHTIVSSAEIPEEMVNLKEDELKAAYPNWKVEKFTKEEVILGRDLESFCGEHYLVIEEEGKVRVYSLNEDNNRTLKEETEIVFDYLPETDKIILRNGIYVYGTEELTKIKEDFES